MPRAVEALIFDFDGTLVDSDEALDAASTLPAPAALTALGRYTVEREL